MSGRYLSYAEREDIAIWRTQKAGVREIARRLPVDFPDDESMRVSHGAIYQALYVQGRGALKRELVSCLRTGRALRVPRARTRQRRNWFITPEVMISARPRTHGLQGHEWLC